VYLKAAPRHREVERFEWRRQKQPCRSVPVESIHQTFDPGRHGDSQPSRLSSVFRRTLRVVQSAFHARPAQLVAAPASRIYYRRAQSHRASCTPTEPSCSQTVREFGVTCWSRPAISPCCSCEGPRDLHKEYKRKQNLKDAERCGHGRPNGLSLSCTARAHVPKPTRRGGCRRGVACNDWRTATVVTP